MSQVSQRKRTLTPWPDRESREHRSIAHVPDLNRVPNDASTPAWTATYRLSEANERCALCRRCQCQGPPQASVDLSHEPIGQRGDTLLERCPVDRRDLGYVHDRVSLNFGELG